jgi:hypothetical protein
MQISCENLYSMNKVMSKIILTFKTLTCSEKQSKNNTYLIYILQMYIIYKHSQVIL